MSGESAGRLALEMSHHLLASVGEDALIIERREASLAARPRKGGYSIAVYDEGELAMVTAERWHSHYDDPEQAAFCAMWLFTPYYRIVHEMKGGHMVAVWLERYEAAGWTGLDPVFFLNPDVEETWALKPDETFSRRYIQQAVLPSPRPYELLSPGVRLDERGFPPDFCDGERVLVGKDPLGRSLA